MFVQVSSRLTSRAPTHSPTLLRFSSGLLSLILLAACSQQQAEPAAPEAAQQSVTQPSAAPLAAVTVYEGGRLIVGDGLSRVP